MIIRVIIMGHIIVAVTPSSLMFIIVGQMILDERSLIRVSTIHIKLVDTLTRDSNNL